MSYHSEDRDGGYCHHECGVCPGFPRQQNDAEVEVRLRAKLEEPVIDPAQAAMVAVVDARIAELMGGEVKP